jgi:hypothetical protein
LVKSVAGARRAPRTAAAKPPSPSRQFATFLARYSPPLIAVAKGALTRLRRLVPGAVELVYDNYNALVVGFGPSERASEAVFSIALYPRWVNLFFLQGATLADPDGLLRGSGTRVRHIVLTDAKVLDDPRVRRLIARALADAPRPLDPGRKRRMVVRAIAPRQRARRPPK